MDAVRIWPRVCVPYCSVFLLLRLLHSSPVIIDGIFPFTRELEVLQEIPAIAGINNGFQQRVTCLNSKALFVLWSNCFQNVVDVHAARANSTCSDFCAHVQELYSFSTLIHVVGSSTQQDRSYTEVSWRYVMELLQRCGMCALNTFLNSWPL